jgi:hypothetical protein
MASILACSRLLSDEDGGVTRIVAQESERRA